MGEAQGPGGSAQGPLSLPRASAAPSAEWRKDCHPPGAADSRRGDVCTVLRRAGPQQVPLKHSVRLLPGAQWSPPRLLECHPPLLTAWSIAPDGPQRRSQSGCHPVPAPLGPSTGQRDTHTPLHQRVLVPKRRSFVLVTRTIEARCVRVTLLSGSSRLGTSAGSLEVRLWPLPREAQTLPPQTCPSPPLLGTPPASASPGRLSCHLAVPGLLLWAPGPPGLSLLSTLRGFLLWRTGAVRRDFSPQFLIRSPGGHSGDVAGWRGWWERNCPTEHDSGPSSETPAGRWFCLDIVRTSTRSPRWPPPASQTDVLGPEAWKGWSPALQPRPLQCPRAASVAVRLVTPGPGSSQRPRQVDERGCRDGWVPLTGLGQRRRQEGGLGGSQRPRPGAVNVSGTPGDICLGPPSPPWLPAHFLQETQGSNSREQAGPGQPGGPRGGGGGPRGSEGSLGTSCTPGPLWRPWLLLLMRPHSRGLGDRFKVEVAVGRLRRRHRWSCGVRPSRVPTSSVATGSL